MQKLTVFIFLLILIACSGQEIREDKGEITVLVSVLPQRYFVEKIAGDLVEVTVLIPPGASPAAYEMSPSDMRRVSEADIWFTIGLWREITWIPEFSSLNERLSIVSTVEDVQRLPIGRYGIPEEHTAHEHEHDHDHGSLDPHVWLSPELVSLQAVVICETLCETDPSNSDIFFDNLALFLEEISDLQNEIHEMIDPFAGEGFMVFHPAWGYFADEFNLIQVPIEISGSEPSPAELARLVNFGKSSSVRVIFVSPQFSESSAETIADELNASVIFIDPLASNWTENLLFVASELAAAVE
ncbi:MAG: zinc ABC transporter substrate-binding protein [Candidatus Sabulitectum sp.]|nr:zinc ABC transporter substrate-binding protein [Candidatus Sabulitectum sp.]